MPTDEPDACIGEDSRGIWFKIQPAVLLDAEPRLAELRHWFRYCREITPEDYRDRSLFELMCMTAMLAVWERWRARRKDGNETQ